MYFTNFRNKQTSGVGCPITLQSKMTFSLGFADLSESLITNSGAFCSSFFSKDSKNKSGRWEELRFKFTNNSQSGLTTVGSGCIFYNGCILSGIFRPNIVNDQFVGGVAFNGALLDANSSDEFDFFAVLQIKKLSNLKNVKNFFFE